MDRLARLDLPDDLRYQEMRLLTWPETVERPEHGHVDAIMGGVEFTDLLGKVFRQRIRIVRPWSALFPYRETIRQAVQIGADERQPCPVQPAILEHIARAEHVDLMESERVFPAVRHEGAPRQVKYVVHRADVAESDRSGDIAIATGQFHNLMAVQAQGSAQRTANETGSSGDENLSHG